VGALPPITSLAVEFLRMRVMELTLTKDHLPEARIVDAGPVIDMLRLRKSADEIAAMRMAVRIAEKALTEVTGWLKPGMTEKQIAGKLTILMFELGGGVLPFEPLVLAGAHAANPHGVPDDTMIKEGEALLFDYGTSYGGYISDLTRCFAIGRPLEGKAKEVYEVVKAANAAGCAAAGPGVPCQDVDRAARKVIDEAGFGEHFFHRVGHGIGLEGHEGPYMVEGNTLRLEEGMCFTVEPGIYIPGEVGIRIEDNLVVTASGVESLTIFKRDMVVIGK